MKRYLSALILGLGGVAILVSLGVWQLRRLEWKEGVIAAIEARLNADPVPLAQIESPDPRNDQYRPVRVSGRTTGQEFLVLSGRKGQGAGFRVISVFQTEDGRRILLDRGFIPESLRDAPRPPAPLWVVGNLLWPDDADSFTPPPDQATGIWFARDVQEMARVAGTEPVMVVARAIAGELQGVEPVALDTSHIPNDHRNYAITWFSLAVVWAGMTGVLVWRIRQRTV
ncbi:surfeit locus 1 family protein [Albidovulum inexpectatum]|uniref:SURF1-like protein n=1 Tax=Albidovulum inexpectatum TaxID=196587 RepID=A0A2S5JI33_9RHOB|nr:SURF1 family protein [Albidovulum inexpectatum]PPB81090.1 surfeit locus 1 family protein [Albidovulum inexpectatum]